MHAALTFFCELLPVILTLDVDLHDSDFWIRLGIKEVVGWSDCVR